MVTPDKKGFVGTQSVQEDCVERLMVRIKFRPVSNWRPPRAVLAGGERPKGLLPRHADLFCVVNGRRECGPRLAGAFASFAAPFYIFRGAKATFSGFYFRAFPLLYLFLMPL